MSIDVLKGGLLPAFTLTCLLVHPATAQTGLPRYTVDVTKYLMGTRVAATVVHSDVATAQAALVAAFQEMERVESVMSVHRPGSDIARVNAAAGQHPEPVSAETFAILTRAQGYAERFEGLFDVTIGPLTALWGFNGDAPAAVPDAAAVETARGLVGMSSVRLHARDTTVFLPLTGMQIDLGGVAKGYAIDRAAAVLRAHGVTDFLLDAGGDLLLSGLRADGRRWRVGVKHPRTPEALLATLEVTDGAVATSGDYERFFDHDGRRYHHILDPRTGRPATASRSVTVLDATAEAADALATYLFLKGCAASYDFPFLGVAGDGTVHQATPLFEVLP